MFTHDLSENRAAALCRPGPLPGERRNRPVRHPAEAMLHLKRAAGPPRRRRHDRRPRRKQSRDWPGQRAAARRRGEPDSADRRARIRHRSWRQGRSGAAWRDCRRVRRTGVLPGGCRASSRPSIAGSLTISGAGTSSATRRRTSSTMVRGETSRYESKASPRRPYAARAATSRRGSNRLRQLRAGSCRLPAVAIAITR